MVLLKEIWQQNYRAISQFILWLDVKSHFYVNANPEWDKLIF